MVDGRTKQARLRKATKLELLRLLGHEPSPPQLVVIEQMSWLTVQIATLDAKMAAGAITNHDLNVYLAIGHQFAKHASSLGFLAQPERRPRPRRDSLTIADLLHGKEAA